MDTSSSRANLQWVNIANITAYFVNVIVTYGVGVSGRFPTNAELSAKYQTLVTPAGYAFSIWGIIFTSQLVWAIFQLLPAYRSSELVVKGVGYNYVFVCLAQVLWTIFFSAEKIFLSLLAMISILIPLVLILNETSGIPSPSVGQYWLCKFPFEVHAAWIMAATSVNFNVVFVAWEASANTQSTFGWISLLVLAVLALYYTYKEKWVVPSVIAWASYAIRAELSNPRDSILNTFPASVIDGTKTASGLLAVFILISIVLTLVYRRLIKSRSGVDADSYTDISN